VRDATRSAVLSSLSYDFLLNIFPSYPRRTVLILITESSNSRLGGTRFVYSLVMPLYSTDCIGVRRGIRTFLSTVSIGFGHTLLGI